MNTLFFARAVRWVGILGLLVAPGALARPPRSIAFVPDPSCAHGPLVTAIEEALEQNFEVKELALQKGDREKAAILVQYFILQRTAGDKLVVQLDARAFENQSGKFLAEGSATSDPVPNDEGGKKAAAAQVGKALAGNLSTSLSAALQAKGKGRRVMLQVSLDPAVLPARAAVLERLKKDLSEMAPRLRGETERSFMVILTTDERGKVLAEKVEKALEGRDPIQATWVMQSDSTLVVSLAKPAK
jgi:hypothetical protein